MAAAHTLLGNIYREKSNTKCAQASYIASLRMDALSWEPFRQLCDMGYDVEQCMRTNNIILGDTIGVQNGKQDGFAEDDDPLEIEQPVAQRNTKKTNVNIGEVQVDESIVKYLRSIARGYNELSLFQCR